MAGALLGALIACLALTVASALHPAVQIEFDEDLPRAIGSGFYPPELADETTFAWTDRLGTVTLRDIDRSLPWRCAVRLRGGRPAGVPEPQVLVAVDGITLRTHVGGAVYEQLEVDAPAASRRDRLSLTITVTPTFVPGPDDRRDLGVQVDRIACSPLVDARVAPSRTALASAGLAGALFGMVFAVLSPTLFASLGGMVLLGAAVAVALDSGLAAYSPRYLEWIASLAAWIAAPVLVLAFTLAASRRTLHPATGFVLSFSTAVLFIKLIALLHPSKDVVDAVFHAHRLGAVLGGSYFFTQPMPGGVQFPYAIGLYVVAMPFAAVISDHVALLRLVVCVFEAFAAASLYVAATRCWNDRLTGAVAVVIYHAAPLPYVIVGNANLTYAFAQSVAVITIAATTVLPFQHGWILATIALSTATALGFLSHVGVFPVLAVTLLTTAMLYGWRGGRELSRAARGVLLATVVASVVAFGSYYAHFPEVYRSLSRVSGPAPDARVEAPAAAASRTPVPSGIVERTARAATLGLRAYGLPMVVLAAVGLGLTWRGPRDRLTYALAACGIAFGVFVLVRTVAPVDPRLQRYADEFIDRLYYATLPAVAILSALAVARGWRRRFIPRGIAVVLMLAVAYHGATRWMQWLS